MRRPLPQSSLAVALLALAAACGGSNAKLEAARHQLALGRPESALAILEDAGGARAEAVRAEVRALLDHRAVAQAELEAFRARRGDRPWTELVAELRAMLADERDPLVRAWLEQERSDCADWAAERDARRERRPVYLPGLGLEPTDDAPRPVAGGTPTERPPAGMPRTAPDDPLLALILEDARAAEAAGSWQQAIATLDMVAADLPGQATELGDWRRRLVRVAGVEAEDLLRRARAREAEEGLEEALRFLVAERWRFPDQGGAAALHRAYEDLLARRPAPEPSPVASAPPAATAPRPAQELRGEASAPPPDAGAPGDASAPSAGDPPDGDGRSAIELGVAAVEAASRDRLAEARDLWRAAAARAPSAAERERHERSAFAAEARLALRAAVEAAEEPGAAPVVWRDLPWERLAVLCEPLELEGEAFVGLALEKLARGRDGGDDGGLADLATALDRGWLERRRCWELVAVVRGEELPPGGYEFRDGQWVAAGPRGESVRRRARALAEVVRVARGEPRERAWAELSQLARASDEAAEEAREALVERWDRAVRRVVASGLLEELEGLAQRRRELDRARGLALELIEDRERYFYPYDPPADDSKSTGEYLRAQAEVERRVAAVRGLWEDPRPVKLTERVREALADLDWVRRHGVAVVAGLALPPEWPPWLASLDTTRETLTLARFSWNADEARALVRSRAVRSLNEARWRVAAQEGQGPGASERDLVRLCNAYRTMLGRHALVWNPRLQQAAQGHSDYMAETGRFGHFEEGDPWRRTPQGRMTRAGYTHGTSENVHSGQARAEAVHAAFLRSSAHHRNLLSLTHRELGCAQSGNLWTQNFGAGTDHESELDEWRD